GGPPDEPWPHCAEGHDTGGPVAMVSVAQLYVRDAPLLRPPGSADLLQVLWCPWDHEPDNKPLTALYWRTAAEVTDVLAEPPEPYAVDYDGYVPQPCLLAPGWKAGGWTSWGLTDPVPRLCPTCGTDMNPLLTIASSEWGSNTRGWIPYEDQSSSESTPGNYRPWNPTLLDLAGGYDLQLHVCPASPDHPHLGLIQ
ncbi:hypothetical protein ABZY31_30895, partial [Streptomyces sp. NPDC006529]